MWQEMTTFLSEITTGWMIVHSILLGAVVCYWGTVILGFLDIDLFGDLDIEGVEDGAEGFSGVFSGLVGFISSNNVPVTICGSFVILIMWLLGGFAHHHINIHIETPIYLFFSGLGVFLVTFTAGCWTTRLITYPLRNVFKTHTGLKTESLVGKRCTVKTSKVTEKFGEAELTVDDSYLQISIRTKEEGLKKGDEAVIFDHDQKKCVYFVGKLQ